MCSNCLGDYQDPDRTAPTEEEVKEMREACVHQETEDAEAAYRRWQERQQSRPKPEPGRLGRLWDAEPQGEERRRTFYNYLLGTLSVLVGDEVWDQCLESAQKCMGDGKGEW